MGSLVISLLNLNFIKHSLFNFTEIVGNHAAHYHLSFVILSIQLFWVPSFLLQLLLEMGFGPQFVFFFFWLLLFHSFKLHVKARLGILSLFRSFLCWFFRDINVFLRFRLLFLFLLRWRRLSFVWFVSGLILYSCNDFRLSFEQVFIELLLFLINFLFVICLLLGSFELFEYFLCILLFNLFCILLSLPEPLIVPVDVLFKADSGVWTGRRSVFIDSFSHF